MLADADILFTAHRDGVFRYLCRIVGREDARELTQEVFLRVARSAVPDNGEGPRRAWVFQIARNLALNHVRDAKRRPATQPLAAAIAEALEHLAPADRDVFLMREAGGLSYAEIAVACRLTPDSVRSRLHRVRQELRAVLGPVPESGGMHDGDK
jgi:RNA polymerase sigma-70 factor (ECF subfamily)